MEPRHGDLVYLRKPLITLETPLKDIPELWLHYVEPKIYRDSYEPCWHWDGRCDRRRQRLIPMMLNPDNGKYLIQTRRWISQLYFIWPEYYHVHLTCDLQTCVNPAHFVINDQDPRSFDREQYKQA